MNSNKASQQEKKDSKLSFTQGSYLVDAGIETYLIFHRNQDLPYFSSFVLLEKPEGRKELIDYYLPFFKMAEEYNLNFIIETPTWRSNTDTGLKLGYTLESLCDLNSRAVRFVREIAEKYTPKNMAGRVLISGVLGPRGDGYIVDHAMTIEEARKYHSPQIQAFVKENVDLITAYTINYKEEAIGIIKAAKDAGVPVGISFTVETDGRLPSGESLKEAIEQADKETDSYASYFMINCAHPNHIIDMLEKSDGDWKKRIYGIRANASTKSHAELEQCESLDMGDYQLLGNGIMKLKQLLPNFKIVGGCCGTDHSHVKVFCEHLFKPVANEGQPETLKDYP